MSVSVWTRSSDGYTEVCVYRDIRPAEAMSLCVCVQGHETGEDVHISLCVYRGIRLRQPCWFESVQGHQTGEDDHVSLCVYKVMCVCVQGHHTGEDDQVSFSVQGHQMWR